MVVECPVGCSWNRWSDHRGARTFRHNYEDACRAAGIRGEVMDVLQGHFEGGQRGRYGSGYTVATLNEEVQRIRYPGVKLDNLPVYRRSLEPLPRVRQLTPCQKAGMVLESGSTSSKP